MSIFDSYHPTNSGVVTERRPRPVPVAVGDRVWTPIGPGTVREAEPGLNPLVALDIGDIVHVEPDALRPLR